MKNGNTPIIQKTKATGIGIPLEQQQTIFEAFQQQEGQQTIKYR